ncbi:MAG: PadR family transcriptional regulator [Actinobacteria bacterium]|nr:PadR family transcriptional regulator [Actinomycetota bacterium]
MPFTFHCGLTTRTVACHSGLSRAAVTDRPLNATAASLLGFLHAGPMTGWDLVATAEVVIGDFWSLTRSQVYRELTAMEAAGLVQAGEVGPRERRPYRLTDAGREAFRRWLEREPGPEQIRYPLLLTIAFGRHLDPERLAAFVAAHRSVHAARLADYETLQGDGSDHLDPYARATLDFGVRYERAVLEWFEHLPGLLPLPPAAGDDRPEADT